MQIPEKGMSREQVLESLRAFRAEDPDWSEGKIFGYVFHADADVVETVEEAFRMYMWDNALDPSVFGSMLKLETEVVEMAARHLNGDDEVVGNLTSGGTETCLLAVKTARDWARVEKPEISQPEMILPITAHPCFTKGAHYFGVKAVTVPVDPQTLTAGMNAVREAINENTVLLVGSASNYAFGTVDPIEELGQLALERGILLHVDGCIGGFILSLYDSLGYDVTPFDFRVPGVTSMSMDLHKYAFAAKGASVVLYKNKALRRHQIFTHSGWTGYTMINPTIQSTKSGGPIAAAWAVMKYLGQEGYREYAQRLREATDRFLSGIAAIDDLYVIGEPEMCLAAVASDTVDIFELCDAMKDRGWHIGPQPGAMGVKESFHITMLPFNTDKVGAMLADLSKCIDVVKDKPPQPIVEQVKAMAAAINPETLTEEEVQNLLGMVGIGDGALPGKMAEINQILNALPPELCDKLLTGFYNEWSRYREG